MQVKKDSNWGQKPLEWSNMARTQPRSGPDFALSPEAQARMHQVTSDQSLAHGDEGRSVRTGGNRLAHWLWEYKNKPPDRFLQTLISALEKAGIGKKQKIRNHRDVMVALQSRNEELKVSQLKIVKKEIYGYIDTIDLSNGEREIISNWKKYIDFGFYGEILVSEHKKFGTGVYTFSFIDLGSDIECIRTQRRCPQHKVTDPLKYPKHIEVELRRTNKDAEVATLNDINEVLEKYKQEKKRYKSINIDILGNFGPCNGCDYRIKQFIQKWNGSELCEELIINFYFLIDPTNVSMGESVGKSGVGKYKTDWGRTKDTEQIVTIRGHKANRQAYDSPNNVDEQIEEGIGSAIQESEEIATKDREIQGIGKSATQIASEFLKPMENSTKETEEAMQRSKGLLKEDADQIVKEIKRKYTLSTGRERVESEMAIFTHMQKKRAENISLRQAKIKLMLAYTNEYIRSFADQSKPASQKFSPQEIEHFAADFLENGKFSDSTIEEFKQRKLHPTEADLIINEIRQKANDKLERQIFMHIREQAKKDTQIIQEKIFTYIDRYISEFEHKNKDIWQKFSPEDIKRFAADFLENGKFSDSTIEEFERRKLHPIEIRRIKNEIMQNLNMEVEMQILASMQDQTEKDTATKRAKIELVHAYIDGYIRSFADQNKDAWQEFYPQEIERFAADFLENGKFSDSTIEEFERRKLHPIESQHIIKGIMQKYDYKLEEQIFMHIQKQTEEDFTIKRSTIGLMFTYTNEYIRSFADQNKPALQKFSPQEIERFALDFVKNGKFSDSTIEEFKRRKLHPTEADLIIKGIRQKLNKEIEMQIFKGMQELAHNAWGRLEVSMDSPLRQKLKAELENSLMSFVDTNLLPN
jgi:hypothetical protein